MNKESESESENSTSSANIASDWLRAKRALLWMRKKKKKKKRMTVSILDLVVDLWEAQPRLWDPE